MGGSFLQGQLLFTKAEFQDQEMMADVVMGQRF